MFDLGSPPFKTHYCINFFPFSTMLDHCLLLHQETTLDTKPITNLYLFCLIKQLHKHVLKDPDVIVIKIENAKLIVIENAKLIVIENAKLATFVLASCKKLRNAFSRHEHRTITPL